MDIHDCGSLKAAARHAPPDSGRLVLLHSAVTAIVSFAILLLTALLDRWIDSAVGIAGLGTRTALSSVGTVVSVAQEVAVPFWEMGYLFTAVALFRGAQVGRGSLLDGFRRFGVVLRFYLLELLIYCVPAMVLYYPAMMLTLLVPVDVSAKATLFTVVYVAAYLVAVVLIFYRVRMARFVLADEPEKGALYALRESLRLTRGSCLALARLDLSFWWYYLLRLAAAALCCGDVLLGYCGVTLPLSQTWCALLFGAAGLLAEVALYARSKNFYTMTFVAALDALRLSPQEPARAKHEQKRAENFPWSE